MFRATIAAVAATLVLVLPVAVRAQVPAVPGVPAAAAPAAAAAAPAAAAPSNIWSMLCMTPQQLEQCKQKICNCSLIKLLGGAMTPLAALGGGVFSCCPGPNDANPNDLLKPPDSAEGAAARIKKNEADAKARRAAVRYLATVDCRRYPEAEAALIHSLRADENECVRLEAAMGLGNGCCCTKKVLEALVLTVSGKKTNDPAETSPRVRLAAALALERCLCKYYELDTTSTKAAEKPGEAPKPVEGTPEPKKDEPRAMGGKLVPEALVHEGKLVLNAFKLEYARNSGLLPPEPTTPRSPVAPLLPTGQTMAGMPRMTTEPALAPGMESREDAVRRMAANLVATAPPVPIQPNRWATANRPPVVAEQRPAVLPGTAEPEVPPTGKRDVLSVIRHAITGK